MTLVRSQESKYLRYQTKIPFWEIRMENCSQAVCKGGDVNLVPTSRIINSNHNIHNLFVTSKNHVLHLWDASTYDPVAIFVHSECDSEIISVDFSLDNVYLASGDDGGLVTIWDLSSLTSSISLQHRHVFTWSVKFPNTRQDIVVCLYSDDNIIVWDITSRQQSQFISMGGVAATNIFIASDDSKIISNARKSFGFWEFSEAATFSSLTHATSNSLLSTSPVDGNEVALAYSSGDIAIWDLISGEEKLVIEMPDSEVYCVCYSANGTRLYTCSSDMSIKVFDRLDNTVRDFVNIGEIAVQIVLSPDETKVAALTSDDLIYVYDIPSGKLITVFKNESENLLIYSRPTSVVLL
jgi:WD40 repeat protein